jgi:hypothetical protein
MKTRYLGLLAAPMLLAQCQPACTPAPPAPVDTTTTTSTTSTTVAPAPYHVTLTAVCVDADVVVNVQNDSPGEIVVLWQPPGFDIVVAPGASGEEFWPILDDDPPFDYLDEVQWEALRTDTEETVQSGAIKVDAALASGECVDEHPPPGI